jgi:HEAT repeat protein
MSTTTPDDDFRPKRSPLAFVLGTLLVAGAGFGIYKAVQADAAKLTPEQATQARKELQLRPKAEQLPEWRQWASRDDVPLLQQEALAQLAWAKDAEGLALVVKSLASVDHRIRGRAAQAVLEYGRDASATVKDPLLKALAEATDGDKPQIAWALATIGAEEAFDATMAEYRAGHLGKLQRLDESPAFDTDVLSSMVSLDRLAALAEDPSESVRQLIATVLSRTGDAKWTEVLIKLVADASVDVAREAAVGLGKIATDAATKPLVDALGKANKESRAKFLEALRDGIGTPGLVLALGTVQKDTADREKFQTKQLFDMMKELEDPRAGEALAAFASAPTHPHWRVEAALRMASVGDLRAVPHLAWRLEQDPLKLYDAKADPEYRRDDNERVYSARMLADLAVLNPDKADVIRDQAEKAVLHWATDLPQPHANAMRALAAMGSKDGIAKIKAWADPPGELPKAGFQGQMPDTFSTAQSALRYVGWSKDEGTFGLFTKQLGRKPEKLDITMDALQQGGLAILGMTLRALEVGASQGMSELGSPKAVPVLMKFIEDPQENEQARLEAGSALGWVMSDADADKVVDKILALKKPDPRAVVVRKAFLEALMRHGAPSSGKKLMDLLDPSIDLAVRHDVARALGLNGLDASLVAGLLEKAKIPELRGDAVLALLLGGTEDDAQRAIAALNDGRTEEVEELKQSFDNSFSYWTSRNYERGDVARWARNAEAATRVRLFGMYPEWPRAILSHALSGLDFDNGPHSMTRVQLRVRLVRDAKSGDAKRRQDALTVLEFTKERGVLIALRTEAAPLGDLARQAYFRVMNPRLSVEAAPSAK